MSMATLVLIKGIFPCIPVLENNCQSSFVPMALIMLAIDKDNLSTALIAKVFT